MSPRIDLSTYVVTDTGLCGGPDGVVRTVRAAVAGGATAIQLRDPGAPDDDLVALGRRLVETLRGTQVPLIVNDRAHLVEPIGADGVHVGQGDLPVAGARAMVGPRAVVGLSVTTAAHVSAAEALLRSPGHEEDVDYLGVGPLRPTGSKPDHDPAIGVDGAAELIGRASVPTCVIGGVTAADAVALRRAGARGMAVVSAVCGQPEPAVVARRLADAWDDARVVPHVLSIAGNDPSGGAGMLADLKVFSALGGYGMGVLTALTAQNTQGVTGVREVPADFVAAQLDTLLADVRVDAVKVGMLGSAEIVSLVASYLRDDPLREVPVVLDPVMVATSGDRLLDDGAEDAVRRLLPLADVVTPNLAEAALLSGHQQARDVGGMRVQARALLDAGARAVMLKGGHLHDTERAVDLFVDADTELLLPGPRHDTPHTHGTGCSLSSALATVRPQRRSWGATAREAKRWLGQAIAAGAPGGPLKVGRGHGPVHHFHDAWRGL